MEKAEVLNAAFMPVLTSKANLQESQVPGTKRKTLKKPLLEKDQVREYLGEVDMQSIVPDGIHP